MNTRSQSVENVRGNTDQLGRRKEEAVLELDIFESAADGDSVEEDIEPFIGIVEITSRFQPYQNLIPGTGGAVQDELSRKTRPDRRKDIGRESQVESDGQGIGHSIQVAVDIAAIGNAIAVFVQMSSEKDIAVIGNAVLIAIDLTRIRYEVGITVGETAFDHIARVAAPIVIAIDEEGRFVRADIDPTVRDAGSSVEIETEIRR